MNLQELQYKPPRVFDGEKETIVYSDESILAYHSVVIYLDQLQDAAISSSYLNTDYNDTTDQWQGEMASSVVKKLLSLIQCSHPFGYLRNFSAIKSHAPCSPYHLHMFRHTETTLFNMEPHREVLILMLMITVRYGTCLCMLHEATICFRRDVLLIVLKYEFHCRIIHIMKMVLSHRLRSYRTISTLVTRNRSHSSYTLF